MTFHKVPFFLEGGARGEEGFEIEGFCPPPRGRPPSFSYTTVGNQVRQKNQTDNDIHKGHHSLCHEHVKETGVVDADPEE